MFRVQRKAPENGSAFKFISWNINGTSNMDKISLFLKDAHPDFIMLQETKLSPKGTAKAQKLRMSTFLGSMNKLGYPFMSMASSTVKAGYSGTALLSCLKPLKTVEFMPSNYSNSAINKEGRLIVLEFEQFVLVNSYIPNAGAGLARMEDKRQFLQELATFLKDFSKKKPIVMGCDFNVCVGLELDCHEDCKVTRGERSGRTPEEAEMMREFMERLDLVDSFRSLNPTAKKWTWLNIMNKSKGMRLDYFLISSSLLKDCSESDVCAADTQGSDHVPICLTLNLEPTHDHQSKKAKIE